MTFVEMTFTVAEMFCWPCKRMPEVRQHLGLRWCFFIFICARIVLGFFSHLKRRVMFLCF